MKLDCNIIQEKIEVENKIITHLSNIYIHTDRNINLIMKLLMFHKGRLESFKEILNLIN